MSSATKSTQATRAEFDRLPEHARVELIRGVLVPKEASSPQHGRALGALNGTLFDRFHRNPGGRQPGGWWLVTDVSVELGEEVFRPDLSGWRRERIPTFPTERPVKDRPDWVCEVLSPSNARTDRVEKLRTYHQHGIPHYWLVDPREETLTVFRYSPGGYVVALVAGREARVKAEPFDAITLQVGRFFGDEPDDSLD
ncbi:MAG: Uma2 family endonuclease [Archangium sp.]